jgi:uncharacterized protein Yka (UPF0111/DUF47 family)
MLPQGEEVRSLNSLILLIRILQVISNLDEIVDALKETLDLLKSQKKDSTSIALLKYLSGSDDPSRNGPPNLFP